MQNTYGNRGSTLQGLLILICVASLIGVAIQWRTLSKLRSENESLRAKASAPATPQPAVVQTSGEDTPEKRELLRLRNEVRQLREQLVAVKTAPPQLPQAGPGAPATTAASPVSVPAETSPEVQMRREEIRQLGQAISKGDSAALDKLAELAATTIKTRTNDPWVMGELKQTFDALGSEAGQGNQAAFDNLLKATRMEYLQGFAISALGQAAAMGNEKALEPLLDPERNLLSRSYTMAALKPAADKGNPRAIEALVAAANDPKRRTMWYTVARGLEKSAVGGNPSAIDALAMIGTSENASTRRVAVQALEKAAKNHPKAAEALNGLKKPAQ